MKHIEVDAQTGEVTERDLTAEEIADIEEIAQRPPIPEPTENLNPIDPPA